MMRKFFTLAIVCIGFICNAQTSGVYYRQFIPNPYLSNPAFVAINDQPEVNIVYRKQWVNFKDAPETSGFSLQYPTNGRVILGMNFMSDKQVLLRNTSILGTFGYVVPITEGESIRFALSAGVGTNKLNLTSDEMNTADPAILNAAQNNTYIDGNFGVAYTFKGLKLGFALTRLFQSDPFSEESFSQFKLSNLKNRLYSASYRFPIGVMEEFAIEPYVLYRQSADGLQDYWEAASMVYFKESLWAGVSYNQHNGIGMFFGMNVMEKFRLSYSYEFPPMGTEFTASSSHELHLGFRFGAKKSRPLVRGNNSYKKTVSRNKKTFSRDMKTDQRMSEKVAQADEQLISSPEEMPVVNASMEVTGDNASSPAVLSVQEAFKEGAPPKSAVLEEGYYVVVGAFSQSKYAYRFSRTLIAKGQSATVALNPSRNLYYVYTFSTYDLEEAKKQRSQFKVKHLMQDAWIFKME